MRVLIAHNAYQQRGGEDSVVAEEAALLRAHGHEVEQLTAHNDDIVGMSRLSLAAGTAWSTASAQEMRARCAAFRPDVVHVHNSFPLLSPSIHWAAQEAGVPVVQTLHNFRLLCPQAMLLRNGQVCEDCVGRLPWRGAVRGCYRGSVAQSAVLAGMLVLHRGLGTWERKVNRFIALNEFCRNKFIQGGLPASRVVVKPNFVDLPAPPQRERRGLLFVGRLSPEKGLGVLAEAARSLAEAVTVVGAGPMEQELSGAPGLRLSGPLPMNEVLARMQESSALVMPSVWYENFPRTLVEAWASGLGVIASRLGAMADLIEDGVTGLLFEAGNAASLREKLMWALDHPQEMAAMGQRAREHYERHFTATQNLNQLVSIYSDAINEGPRHG